MKTFLVNLGLDAISPEWMFVGAVLFFVLGCLEILAILLENLPGLVVSLARDQRTLRGGWARGLISLAVLPGLFLAASGLLWFLSHV